MENTSKETKNLCKISVYWEMLARVAGMDSGRKRALCSSFSSCWLQMALLGSGQLFRGIEFLKSQQEKKCRLSGWMGMEIKSKLAVSNILHWLASSCLDLSTFELFLNYVFRLKACSIGTGQWSD